MLITYTVVLFVLFNKINSFELVSTHIFYRHGDRSPSSRYPTSLTNEFSWRNGYGQLTIRGQIQHIRLGLYLRKRYSQLLNSTYIASEIYIQSSDYDRTLMSAYSNLLGLYPSSNDTFDIEDENTWPSLLPWQPIPVHTAPKPTDYLMGVSNCPRFFELVEQIINSEPIQNLTKKYRNFLDELQLRTGMTMNTIFDGWYAADTILIEVLYNKAPSWVDSTIINQLKEITDLSFYYLFNSSETSKLISGPMLRDIMNNMENFIANKSNGLKAKIYSGHDASIIAILSFFQVNYLHRPAYCSSLFFDLYYSSENQKYYLKFEYLNSTDTYVTYPIKLPPCDDIMCPFEIINSWVKNRLPNEDMNMECTSHNSSLALSRFNHGYTNILLVLYFLINI